MTLDESLDLDGLVGRLNEMASRPTRLRTRYEVDFLLRRSVSAISRLREERDELAATLEDREDRLTATAKRWLAAEALAARYREALEQIGEVGRVSRDEFVAQGPALVLSRMRRASEIARSSLGGET